MIDHVDAKASRALQDIADRIAAARKILVVTGAGISTNCGIPDFRSKTGLYSLIESEYASQAAQTSVAKSIKGRDMFDASVWNAPDTAAVFLRFVANFRQKVARDVREPSATHRFIKLLRDQRRLVRAYTQNIDGLEQRVGLRADLSHGRGSRSRFTKRSLTLPVSPSNILPGGDLYGGCESVQLHGDLDVLRCSMCQRLVEWEESSHSNALLEGLAPECPTCVEHNTVRQAAGRRSTRIGVLRPNIVLYGEEHPSADAIGPLVTSDIASRPDLLLIFGTSLKVHGLQKIVREFANVVHSRNKGTGNVIFINNTAPAESTWKGVIDTWVDLDCDSFVSRMKKLRPEIWTRQAPISFPTVKTVVVASKSSIKIELHEKENMAKCGAVSLDSNTVEKGNAHGNIRKVVNAVKLPKKRKVLGDIGNESRQSRPDNSSSGPGKKRKHSFEIYEDEPIIVSSKASWVLESVSVPPPPRPHSAPQFKRVKLER